MEGGLINSLSTYPGKKVKYHLYIAWLVWFKHILYISVLACVIPHNISNKIMSVVVIFVFFIADGFSPPYTSHFTGLAKGPSTLSNCFLFFMLLAEIINLAK